MIPTSNGLESKLKKNINNKKSVSLPSYISVLILRINQKKPRTYTIHSQILEFQFYWHYTILYYTTDVAWSIYTVCWFTTFWLLKSNTVSRNSTLDYRFWSFHKQVRYNIILCSSPSNYKMNRKDNWHYTVLLCPGMNKESLVRCATHIFRLFRHSSIINQGAVPNYLFCSI